MTAVVRALKIPVERLTGQPYADSQRDEQTHRDIDGAAGNALWRYDLSADLPAWALSDLTADVDAPPGSCIALTYTESS
ncbi:MAG: hypothetical protein ACRDSL_01855 [Pseudonocardiaceae bacterium]